MSELTCELKNHKQLVFNNFPIENQRKLMKLKIFLNSNKNLNYNFNSKKLEINYLLDDDVLIGKEVSKIVLYIENLFSISIKVDEETQNNLVQSDDLVTNFKNGYKKLRELKSKDYTKDISFNDYIKFCDETLSCKLRPYQYSASYFLTIGQGGFDFSVPGSGKTIITYSAYNYLRANNICDSILIIGPINSYNAWFDEYETCFGINPDFISLAELSKNDSEIYLLSSRGNHKEITFINIDKAWRMKEQLISFMSNKSVLLIIDEAHKEKNPNAEITKAVMEITKKAKYRIILTGTPMPNGYEDLYSLMKIYEPYEKVLPFNYNELKKFTKKGANEVQQLKIMDSIKPIYSRVSKAHLLKTGELLPPNYHIIKCVLSNEQHELYNFLNQMAFELDNDFESSLNQSLMKAILIRKMQISANPGLLTKSIVNSIEEYKKEYTEEFGSDNSDSELLIEADNDIKKAIAKSSIANLIYKFDSGYYNTPKNLAAVKLAIELVNRGESVILWDVFVHNMNTLKKLLNDKKIYNVEMINGTINGVERQNAINRFKNGESKILIANPATLAESISLHKCCQNAIYVNRNYNAAQFIQSKDRIHRINMPKGKTANYFFLINEDTVDDVVQERLIMKENRMLKILDSDELKIGGCDLENTSFMSLEDVIISYKK